MTRWILPLTLIAGLGLASDAAAHGGTYRGPGDTVPPAGGGAAAPTAPAPPAAPSPAAPATPTTPTAPSTPSTPNVPTVPTANKPKQAVTAAADTGPDLTTWEFWWEFNKEPYLNLKSKIHGEAATTGESELLVGLGGVSTKNNTFAPSAQQITGQIIPTLKESLQRDDNRDILSSDLIALAKIGRDLEIPTLFQPFLSHNNQEVAETAALSYGILQFEDAIPELKDLALDTPAGRKLVDKESGVPLRSRTFAAYGLGLVGHATANDTVKNDLADTLWNLLITDDSSLKDLRVATVIGIGLLELSEPKRTEMIENLSGFLGNEDNDFLVRAHCPNAMAKLIRANPSGDRNDGDDAVEQFIDLLGSRDTKAEVRMSCVQAMGMLTHANAPYAGRVVDMLMELEDKGRDRQEKNFTAISLAYIAATDTSSPIHGKVTEFLIKKVEKGSTAYRPWAAMALGVMNFRISENKTGVASDLPARTIHEKFNKAKAPSERAAYAVALGLMKAEFAADDMRKAIEKTRDPGFRGYCCVGLGLMGAREHKDYISDLVEESRRLPDLLRQASIGLGLMNDHAVVDTLVAQMNPEDGGSPPVSVLAAVATALGFIGDHRSVQPLTDFLRNDRDYTPLARAFAAVALGIVADKEQLPWNSKIGEDLNYRASVDTLTDSAGATGVLDIL